MDPLVSVVIPAYNRAHTIEKSVRSVQSQTFVDWELIVSDDGSKDNTAEIVTRLSQDDPRVRYIRHDPNRGAQAARNAGIKAAKGEWIAFLDSDDQYLPDSLEVRLEVARKEKVHVVHSECYIVFPDEPMKLYGRRPLSGRVYSQLLRLEGPVFPALLVSREAMKRINYLDENITSYQEWDTVIRLARHYEFAFVPKPTFIYDYRTPDAISRSALRAGKGYEEVFRKHWKDILLHAGPRAIAYHYNFAAKWYQDGGDEENAKRCRRWALFWNLLNPTVILRKIWSIAKR